MEYLERHLDPERLWREIRSLRNDPGFIEAVQESEWTRIPVEATLKVIAPREEGAERAVARFLGILPEMMDRSRDPWKELFSPAFYDIERALVRLMPDDIPGDLVFDVDMEGRLGLLYLEESPAI